MNSFLHRSLPRAHGWRRACGMSGRCAATIGLAFTLGACAQSGLDDVKPTATTAYRTAQPGATQPAPAPER